MTHSPEVLTWAADNGVHNWPDFCNKAGADGLYDDPAEINSSALARAAAAEWDGQVATDDLEELIADWRHQHEEWLDGCERGEWRNAPGCPTPLADAFEAIARIDVATERAVTSGDASAVLAALAPLADAVLELQVAARDARNAAADRLAAMADGGES